MLELRDYQERALANVEKAEREGVRRPLVVHPTGTGKGHPGHTDILTTNGWRKWADLSVGDFVFGGNGLPTAVTAVYDRGVLPTYRATFSDRSTVEVDADHLWSVSDGGFRRTPQEHRVISTREILSEGLLFGNSRRWSIPVTQVLFHADSPVLPIGPYTLGALIANGSLAHSGTILSTPDPDVIRRIRAVDRHQVNTCKTTGDECPRYSLPGLSGHLRTLGLRVLSRDKFIPEAYLMAGPGERLALLQGLMDGDGSSREGRRTANYHTTSPSLARDVRHLVMSLGGTATVGTLKRDRRSSQYLDITVRILLPSRLELFGTDRKKGRSQPRRIFEPRRTIVAIDRVNDQPIRCIAVAASDHLYVVGRDFIVTHNTVTFGAAVDRRRDRGRSLLMVHRDELASQTIEKLGWQAPELSSGLVKAGSNEVGADLVVASVQTGSRDSRLAQIVASQEKYGRFGTIIVDEAHHAPAPTWTKMLDGLGAFNPYGPLAIGFTATPERDNGKTLGVWEKVVDFMSIREAIYGGHLVPILPAVVVETKMDMKRVKKGRDGDLAGGDLGRELEDSGAIEQMADAVVQHAAERKGVAFLPTIRTSELLADALRQRGIKAEHLDGNTEEGDRRAILRRLKTGEAMWVTNCAVLTEGFDEPSISCVLVGRPTKFHGLYVQMVGRGTRKCIGKENLLVIDVVGASQRHELIGVVDLGLDLDDERKKKLPGEETDRQACPTCQEPCEVDYHRCNLCNRYLPAVLVAEGDTRHENCRASSGRIVDVFGASRMTWLPVDGAWVLGAGKEVVVMVPVGIDTWRLASYEGGRVNVLHDMIPNEWAMGIGEDRAKAFLKLAERSARWRNRPVSPIQKSRLIREGLAEKALPKVKTAGQAADLVTRIQGRRAVKKLNAL